MKIVSRNKKLYLHFSHNGQMVRKSMKMEDNAKNKAILQKQIIPEIQKQLVLGEFFEKEKKYTLDEFAKISFSLHKSNRKELTHISYTQIYDLHISPTLGKIYIDDFKRSQLLQWQNMLSETKAYRTVKMIRTILVTIFEDAYKDELIKKNVLRLVPVPTGEDVIKKQPFSFDEIYTILDNASESIRAYFAVGFFTGMRTGEIIGLKWSDIDFDKRQFLLKEV